MVLPLDEFPPAMRDHILAAVAQPTPPPRWLDVTCAQITSRAWYEWHLARGNDPRKSRNPLRARTRELVIMRDGLVCGLCGGDVLRDDVHIDHVLPRLHGGTDALDNLQVAHSLCNTRKGARV